MPTPTSSFFQHIVGEGVLDFPQTIITKPYHAAGVYPIASQYIETKLYRTRQRISTNYKDKDR